MNQQHGQHNETIINAPPIQTTTDDTTIYRLQSESDLIEQLIKKEYLQMEYRKAKKDRENSINIVIDNVPINTVEKCKFIFNTLLHRMIDCHIIYDTLYYKYKLTPQQLTYNISNSNCDINMLSLIDTFLFIHNIPLLRTNEKIQQYITDIDFEEIVIVYVRCTLKINDQDNIKLTNGTETIQTTITYGDLYELVTRNSKYVKKTSS